MRVRAVGTAVVCALLAGCGGASSGAAVLPQRHAAGAPAATAAPSRGTDEIAAEAVAAVRAYYAEVNRAIATGDTSRLRAMTLETCVCRELVDGIAAVWRTGEVRERAVFGPTSYRPHDVYPTVASVTVDIEGRAYEIVERSGRLRKRVPAERLVQDVEVVRRGASWLVSDVRLLKS